MPESRSRTRGTGGTGGGGRTGGTRATESNRARSERATPQMPPPRQPVCPVGFCPVGMALTVAESVRPEVVEHLMKAGAELMLAMKAIVDARVEGLGRESPLERITIE